MEPALLLMRVNMISEAVLEATLDALDIKIPLQSWCRHFLIKLQIFIELRNWTSAGLGGGCQMAEGGWVNKRMFTG